MTKIRVLVVEDSLTVRRQLCDVIAGDPALDLVGEAADGQQAIDLCAALRPCGKLATWGLDADTERQLRQRHQASVARALTALEL